MRNFLPHIVLLTFASFGCFGQTDTIQVSRDYKTILVFPNAFDFAINGKDLNFVESFPKGSNATTARNIVMLIYNEVAPDKTDYTNYTVYTQDGLAYDFILELVEIPKRKRWTIDVSMADNKDRVLAAHHFQQNGFNPQFNEPITVSAQRHQLSSGMEQPDSTSNKEERYNDEDIALPVTMELYKNDKKEYFRRRCYYNQFNKGKIVRFYARSGDVFLWLKGVYYDNNELYLQFRAENKERIDYDLNFLKFSIATNYRNSSSNQKLDHPPLYQYKVPNRIEGHSDNHFVVVFEKFTLDRKKVLLVEMDEERGNRNISLKIDHDLINKPLSF